MGSACARVYTRVHACARPLVRRHPSYTTACLANLTDVPQSGLVVGNQVPNKPSCKTLLLVMLVGLGGGANAGEGWGVCCVVDFGVLDAPVLRQERRRGEMNLRKDTLGSAPPPAPGSGPAGVNGVYISHRPRVADM